MRGRLSSIAAAAASVALIAISLAWAAVFGTQALRLVRTAASERRHLESDRELIPMLGELRAQVAALRDEVARESLRPVVPQGDSALLGLFGSAALNAGAQLAAFSPPGSDPAGAGRATFSGDFQALVRVLRALEHLRGLTIDQVALEGRGGVPRLGVRYRTIPGSPAPSVPAGGGGG